MNKVGKKGNRGDSKERCNGRRKQNNKEENLKNSKEKNKVNLN